MRGTSVKLNAVFLERNSDATNRNSKALIKKTTIRLRKQFVTPN